MVAICVDDEQILLDWLDKEVSKSQDITDTAKFTDEVEALEYAKTHPFDMTFLDIELRSMSGIELAEKLREINPDCGIVFCTGHPNYAVDAIAHLTVNGYLIKPIAGDAVQREIDRYKNLTKNNSALFTLDLRNGVNIFDKNGKPLHFKRGRSELLFSILASKNGESLTSEQLCNMIWEDSSTSAYLMKKNANYLTQLLTDIRRTLDSCENGKNVLKKDSTGYSLRMSLIRVIE